MPGRSSPNDPGRRARLVDATLDLITERGVAAVTARAVAARAEVPLGSVSYHFASVPALLLEASRRVIEQRAGRLERWFGGVTADDVPHRLAELVHHHLTSARAETIVAYELYVLGLRDEQLRAVSDASIPVLRQVLARSIGERAGTHLAAAADGFQLESLFRPSAPTLVEISQALAIDPVPPSARTQVADDASML